MSHEWIAHQLANERRETIARDVRALRRRRQLRTPRFRRLSL
jgi:hypothetical protein